MAVMAEGRITVFLADDNLIVREGVRALLSRKRDIEVVGVASDYDELVAGARELVPQVVVTDIRMPPSFQREGIDAAKEVRKRNPGTGIVILSQYEDPEYAISLLEEGQEGYAYLLKDRLAEGDQLMLAIKTVAIGGTWLDPSIVAALMHPVTSVRELSKADEQLLELVAQGKPIKAIAAARRTTPAAASAEVEKLFIKIAQEATTGEASSIRHLRLLHQAIIDREEEGESLSRLLPGGLADMLRAQGREIGETEMLDVTVIMSDIRGYSGIAEHANPAALAGQLNTHRAEMNRAIIDNGGTVMQFVGDAVMAVFGAPMPSTDHAARALAAAKAMHERQAAVNAKWAEEDLAPFGLGIGLSTGEVAAALLGSEDRLEYTLVGDTVNLSARLQQLASPGETVLSEPTYKALEGQVDAVPMPPELVKGRQTPVQAYLVPATP